MNLKIKSVLLSIVLSLYFVNGFTQKLQVKPANNHKNTLNKTIVKPPPPAPTPPPPPELKPDEQIEEIHEDEAISTKTIESDNTNQTNSNKTDEFVWEQNYDYSLKDISNSYEQDVASYNEAVVNINNIKKFYERDLNSDPDARPKDPFETTLQYDERLRNVSEKYKNIYQPKYNIYNQQKSTIEKKIYLKSSDKNVEFKLDKYNADKSNWLVSIKDGSKTYQSDINIAPAEAKLLWDDRTNILVNEPIGFIEKHENEIFILYNHKSRLIVLKKTNKSENDEYKVFTKVEVDASYPGGYSGWATYLRNNLNSLVPTDHGAPPGNYTIMVRFIVAKDGSVSDVIAETNHGFGMEQEAVRVIKKSGKWTPAMQNGKNVMAYKRQPLTFLVQE